MPLMAPSTSFVAVDGVDVLVLDLDEHPPELLDGGDTGCRPGRSGAAAEDGSAGAAREGADGQERGARIEHRNEAHAEDTLLAAQA